MVRNDTHILLQLCMDYDKLQLKFFGSENMV